MHRVWLCLAALALAQFCRAEPLYQNAATDSLGRRHYLLSTVRVIADSPSEAIGAVHLVNLSSGGKAAPLSLYEALQGIGGISNTTGTKDESNLRIRGFRKNEVKLLIDGRPLNSGYFGNVDLHQLPPSEIREIQIVKGPGSALYGSGTMGGIVNIITREPSREGWLKLGLTAKRNNANRLSLTSSHRLGEFGYWVYLAREHNEGLVLSEDFEPTAFENGGVRNHSRKTQYDLQTRLDWQPDPFHTLGFSAGAALCPEKLIPSSVYERDYRLYKDWLRSWSTLEYEGILSGSLKLGSHLYYDAAQDTYQQFNDLAHEQLNVDSDMRSSTLGLSPRLEWRPGKGSVLNVGLRAENMRSTRKDNGSYPEWTPHWLNVYNGFSQAEQKLSSWLKLSGSLGLSSHHCDLKHALSLYAEPSAGIYLNLSEHSEASLSLGRNISFPTMRQLFSAENGNPDLKPQQALKLELDQQHNGRRLGISYSERYSLFFNEMRDLIDIVGEGYQNLNRVRSWGGEYTLLLKPLAWLELRFNYAYLDYLQDSDYRLTESPRNQAGATGNLTLPWKLELSYSASYADLRYSQDSSGRYRGLHSYWLHGIGLSRSWGRHQVALGIENLFDADYEGEYGYPAAGLNFYVNLSAGI
jgi:iron complex outermembrane receptor protein